MIQAQDLTITPGKRRKMRRDLTMIAREPVPINYMSDDELMALPVGSEMTF
jgi:N6-adenosine-specific RNA methylase IME4